MRAGVLLLLLLAATLLAGDADAVKKALGNDRVAVALRVEREFAMPRCVFLRGRFEKGKFDARMTIAGDPGEAEWGPRELRLAPGAFEENGEPFEADWIGPSCGIGASLPALLRAVADGPVKGDRLKELLKPLAPAFRIIHPVDAVDYGKASCDGTLTVEKGELRAFEIRLSLGGGWIYKVSGTVRAGADKAPDPEAWGTAPGPPDIELGKIPEVSDDAVRKAIARGLAYLLSIQQEDGSWVSDQAAGVPYPSQRVPITAVCLHAAAACGAERKALERGLAALEDMRKRGVLEGEKPAHDMFDFSVWGSAFGLVHLDGALRHWPGKKPDATALAKAYVDFAWRKQKPCGGWSYRANDKDGSQTILCAAHVEGLLLWKARGVEVDEARLARAVADLKGNRDRKGSFGYYHEGKYESTKGMGWTTPESIGRSVQGQL
ncbi:MAG TPA: hypothetical protein VFY93_09305, partial [Planctomycetota bacterium]|nr:hypothetical protein [Planctomycetota bacterium]